MQRSGSNKKNFPEDRNFDNQIIFMDFRSCLKQPALQKDQKNGRRMLHILPEKSMRAIPGYANEKQRIRSKSLSVGKLHKYSCTSLN